MAETTWLPGACEESQAWGVRERALLEACPLPMWIVDLETHRIRHANAAACRLYGWTPEEFARLSARDFQVDDAGDDVLASGAWRHRLKDGTTIDVEVSANETIFLGRRSRFVCPHDVSEHLRTEALLRERKAFLRRAQSMAHLAHQIVGPGGAIESWSDSLPGLVGLALADVPRTARDWLPLVHPDDRERFRTILIDAARTGRPCEADYRLVRPDGETIHVHAAFEPIQARAEAARGRWFCTLQDVTAQKRAQEAVQRANDELEAHVAERTMQLQVSNCELAFATAAAERANRSKSEFLSNMSHELRTPLNAIVGFGQLLAMPGLMERDEAQRNGFIQHIVDGGRHLLTLINEVLNLAQIEAGKVSVNLERIAIGPLLAECDAMVDPLAERRNVMMRFPQRCELVVQADRMRLKQVLLNLVSNAIKYNREGGKVHVRCDQVDQHVRVSVHDTGHGLMPDQVDALFEAFNRLGQDTSSEEGSGIGLVVTKRLVELMGGRMGVSSEVGVGSVFWFELPCAAPKPASVPASPGDAGYAWGSAPVEADDQWRLLQTGLADAEGTILCVDDNPTSLRLLQQVLSTLPRVHLVSASNGRLGVEMAIAHAPSLIVMDQNMPEMNGREALRCLRSDPRTAAIPVIALSANAMPDDIASGLEAGFLRYLTKPFEVPALLQAVGDALAQAGTRETLD